MSSASYQLYDPLGVLKPVADDVWIVDGPEIKFRYGFLRIPFPTRMTVVRLPDGGLWLHSPCALNDDLAAALAQLGRVAHLVAPNSIHYWWVREWQARFPEARIWAVAKMARGARARLPLHSVLSDLPPVGWRAVIDQVIVDGPRIMEAEFFHRPSRTLIMTDFIENFERSRVRSRFYKWMFRIGGVSDPDGKMPSDLRSGYRKQYRAPLQAAVERMVGWNPARVIIAHGRWYDGDGAAELRRAFRWVF